MQKKFIRALGLLISFCAIAYFIYFARKSISSGDLSALLHLNVALSVALLIVLYCACVLPNAYAWRELLRALGQGASFGLCAKAFAVTQVAKYVPGNVAQHIGRVALIRSKGIPVAVGLYSLGYEIILSSLASLHIGALVLIWDPPPPLATLPLMRYRVEIFVALTVLAACALALAPISARLLARIRNKGEAGAAALPLSLKSMLISYLCYGSGLIFIGLGLWVVASQLPGTAKTSPMFFIGAFAASWIAGFLAPGAPAGLGVREAVLTMWLTTVMAPAQAVILVFALRVATTLGDLINFLLGSIATAMASPERNSINRT